MCIGLLVKYLLFLFEFNEIWIFSTDFRKLLRYQISWKSVRWEPSCSIRADTQTNGGTWWSYVLLFEVVRTGLKNDCPILISGKNTRSFWVLWAVFLVHALRWTTCFCRHHPGIVLMSVLLLIRCDCNVHIFRVCFIELSCHFLRIFFFFVCSQNSSCLPRRD